MYKVTIDRQKRLISIVISGFVEIGEADHLTTDLRAAVRNLRSSGAQFDMITDLREASVLPSESVAESKDQAPWLIEHGLRKSVALVSSMLMKMQVDRVTAAPNFASFVSEEEAMDWLSL